eukprot:TRINITY_DN19580_c2_g1_i1.p1 TRINITY_DN19580_c2_g1~~TRINITY_DN19580_c2_g1_i1.p1  ORF type:complete len:451 (+),score=133.36 TRINITY_DN19580_c2_g1_i1:77-1354(+)
MSALGGDSPPRAGGPGDSDAEEEPEADRVSVVSAATSASGQPVGSVRHHPDPHQPGRGDYRISYRCPETRKVLIAKVRYGRRGVGQEQARELAEQRRAALLQSLELRSKRLEQAGGHPPSDDSADDGAEAGPEAAGLLAALRRAEQCAPSPAGYRMLRKGLAGSSAEQLQAVGQLEASGLLDLTRLRISDFAHEAPPGGRLTETSLLLGGPEDPVEWRWEEHEGPCVPEPQTGCSWRRRLQIALVARLRWHCRPGGGGPQQRAAQNAVLRLLRGGGGAAAAAAPWARAAHSRGIRADDALRVLDWALPCGVLRRVVVLALWRGSSPRQALEEGGDTTAKGGGRGTSAALRAWPADLAQDGAPPVAELLSASAAAGCAPSDAQRLVSTLVCLHGRGALLAGADWNPAALPGTAFCAMAAPRTGATL